jgi:tetratricopeptide (TPR) repeat protein
MSSFTQKTLGALCALALHACTSSEGPAAVADSSHVASVVATPALRPDAGPPPVPSPAPGPVDALALAHAVDRVDHLERSRALANEGDVAGALAEARRAVFTTPKDLETLTQLARLARRAQRHGLAAEAWKRVAALNPDDALAEIQRGRALLAMHDAAAALDAAQEAIIRDSGNAEAFQLEGLSRLSLGHLASAISSFEKVVELAPNHGWAHNNLGLACLRANQNQQAVAALERAAELLPAVAYVHNNLGVALERVGRTDEAKAAYVHAMDLSPKYVKARVNAARVARASNLEPSDEVNTTDDPEVDDLPAQLHPLPE